MYITAMWLCPPRGDRGVNIYIHKHSEGLPGGGDVAVVSQKPGPDDVALRRIEVRSGGNRVEAYLDIAIEDGDYSPDLLEEGLADIKARLDAGTFDNPLQIDKLLESGHPFSLRFSVSNSMAGPESKRRIFDLLHGTLRAWLRDRMPIAA